MNVQDILTSVVAAEREAAALILQAHGILAECKSGRRDVVTEYDRRVQELLTARLSEAVSGARFFCEENDRHDDLNAEHLFIIDPIDGTMNFVRRLNHSCISVAYCSRGERLCGAVLNPYAEELFTAVRGEGAFLNGKPIHVDEAPLSETLVVCGTAPYSPEAVTDTFRLMEKAYRASLDIRRHPAAGLGRAGSVQRGGGPRRGLLRDGPVPLGLRGRRASGRGGRRHLHEAGRFSPALRRLPPDDPRRRPRGIRRFSQAAGRQFLRFPKRA